MNDKPKIAIIIPTIHKDKILMNTLNSILDNWEDNWRIYIIDQNKTIDYSIEKNIFYKTACSSHHLQKEQRIKVISAVYDCGLSVARNLGILEAKKDNIAYILMSADSIKFTESMKKINYLIKYLNYSKKFNIDLIGLDLKERIGWESFLDLKDSFILDFIDKEKQPDEKFADLESIRKSDEWTDENGKKALYGNVIDFWHCDIVRNFFLATTKSLLNIPWDNNGKMSEHCPYFWEYKKAGYKVSYTDYCNGEYLNNNDKIYKSIRNKNLQEGRKYFMEKYNLKKWITYKYLERIK